MNYFKSSAVFDAKIFPGICNLIKFKLLYVCRIIHLAHPFGAVPAYLTEFLDVQSQYVCANKTLIDANSLGFKINNVHQ